MSAPIDRLPGPPGMMEMPVTVSVSMLVYNHGRYLRRALDSILMQQVDFRYQIVVGEDASKDDSREILLEYAARYPGYFCLILHEKNVGITENVKSRLPYLTGEFIAPLEGDDYWLDPKKLQKQVDFLRRHADFSAVAHRVVSVNEAGEEIPDAGSRRLYCREAEFTREHFMRYLLPGQTGSMLFRNYLLGFSEQQRQIYAASPVMGDRKLALVNLFSGRICCMPEAMSAYRRHPGSWNAEPRPGGTSCYQYFESFELEKLAQELWGISLDFSSYRLRAWFGTAVFFLRHPSPANGQALWRVWHAGGKRLAKLGFLIWHALSYPLRRIFKE